jgi:hypothetical protein
MYICMHQMYTISIANRIRWKQVCEALSANGLEMYVGLFQREALDGGKLALLDEAALVSLGIDATLSCSITNGHL